MKKVDELLALSMENIKLTNGDVFINDLLYDENGQPQKNVLLACKNLGVKLIENRDKDIKALNKANLKIKLLSIFSKKNANETEILEEIKNLKIKSKDYSDEELSNQLLTIASKLNKDTPISKLEIEAETLKAKITEEENNIKYIGAFIEEYCYNEYTIYDDEVTKFMEIDNNDNEKLSKFQETSDKIWDKFKDEFKEVIEERYQLMHPEKFKDKDEDLIASL